MNRKCKSQKVRLGTWSREQTFSCSGLEFQDAECSQTSSYCIRDTQISVHTITYRYLSVPEWTEQSSLSLNEAEQVGTKKQPVRVSNDADNMVVIN